MASALPGGVTGASLVQSGGPHAMVGQRRLSPGLSPVARRLRDSIAQSLRERFQKAGRAGHEAFVRQQRSWRHRCGPQCVHVQRAFPLQD